MDRPPLLPIPTDPSLPESDAADRRGGNNPLLLVLTILGAMFVLYDKAKSATVVATAVIHAGAEFDTGTSEPIQLFEVALRDSR